MKKYYYLTAILALYHSTNTMQRPDKDIENPLMKTIMFLKFLSYRNGEKELPPIQESIFRDDRRKEELKWEPHLINNRNGYQSIHCISHTQFSIHPLNSKKNITQKKPSKNNKGNSLNKALNQKAKVLEMKNPIEKKDKK